MHLFSQRLIEASKLGLTKQQLCEAIEKATPINVRYYKRSR
jgi:hypothetical protein